MDNRNSEHLRQVNSVEEFELENRRLREDLEIFRSGFESVSSRELLLREILDHAPFGVMIRNCAGRIVDCNRKLCDFLGRRRECLLGVEADAFFVEGSEFPFSERSAWGSGYSGDVELSLPGGKMRTVQLEIQSVERDGETLQVVYLHDLTCFRERVEALRVSAFTDVLTGIWNRAYFHGRLLEEMERARRYGSALSLILFDIDRFKDFNDSFGHICGDSILKRLADLVGSRIRISDCFCRWGGDEFLIFSPVSRMEAHGFAERLRMEVRNAHWPNGLRLTLSLGVVDFVDGNMPVEVLLERVDQAMYRAKRQGGDRVCFWSEDQFSSGSQYGYPARAERSAE